ncbi:MAG: T9SS type A sorting domain-containing protein [Candidatus Latescibacteria bacterium]|nr:T9SS type A sorting domain-containing protein [Candidatus Latescibacterota bacterium]
MKTIIINILVIAALLVYAVPACADDVYENSTKINIDSSVDIDSMTDDKEEKSTLSTLYRNLDHYQNPKWSPDGKWIGFEAGHGIWIVPVEGGLPVPAYHVLGKMEVDESGTITGGETSCAYLFGFTPDSREMTFVVKIFDAERGSVVETVERNGYEMTGIYGSVPIIINVDIETGEKRTIVEESISGGWSPSGRYFAYQKMNLEGQIEYQRYMDAVIYEHIGDPETSQQKIDAMYDGLFVLDMETGEKWLVSEKGGDPCFTPDDEYVIFGQDDASGVRQLYRVPRMGGEIEQLTFYAEDEDGHNTYFPDISPDGQWILHTGIFGEHVSPYSGVYLFHVPTGQSFPLYPDSELRITNATWSSDGTQILFSTVKYPEMTTQGIYFYTTNFRAADYLNPTGVDIVLPEALALIGNFPNPFNPSTTIEFSLPQTGYADLVIYNVTGQKVRELISGQLNQGVQTAVWDGHDDQGLPVSAGVYVTRLRAENAVTTNRMMLVK